MSSPDSVTETSSQAQPAAPTNPLSAIINEVPAQDEVVEAAEFDDSDSTLGSSNSNMTSIASSIYAGYVENGRRYQTLRDGEYFMPSDERQFEAAETIHLTQLIVDSNAPNSLFRSPISEKSQNILDIGTGSGIWARDVADKFPSAVVMGVDLYPPPDAWVAPNCKMEVDDVLKPWTWTQKWDLIHIRTLAGSFTDEQWRLLYKQIYKNLKPGGYIEQVEWNISHHCDDGTLPPDSYLANWGPTFVKIGATMGKRFDICDIMKDKIEAAGFEDLQEKLYKIPLGDWAKNPVLREAGKFNKLHLLDAMEGYAMFLLTKFGEPEPWSAEEVQVYLAKVREDINNKRYHAYSPIRRIWARKPLDA